MKRAFDFYLASGSPRRKELLTQVIEDFEVVKVDADETCLLTSPAQRVMYTALVKAEHLSPAKGQVYLTADTIVYCQGRFLGKPHSEAEAKEMLSLLNHKVHSVWTGVCIKTDDFVDTFADESLVRVDMTDEQIDAYVASGSPLDKAGAYGIQDELMGASLASGSFANVMGLPIEKLKSMLGIHRLTGDCYVQTESDH